MEKVQEKKSIITMTAYRILLPLIVLGALFTGCGNDEPEKILDFRDDLVGTYDCLKYNSPNLDDTFATRVELVVEKDEDDPNSLLINDFVIPVDENGDYGPDFIEAGTQLELTFDGDNIDFRMQPFLINGLALPCIFIGEKK